jgi:hypothetical protein
MTLGLSCLLLAPCVLGCSNLFNQHAQTMDAMRGVMSDTAARLSESGTGQIQAGGQVINPGIRVAGGVEYYAIAQYEGVTGQVQASMQGDLSRVVPPDVQERINSIWRNTSIEQAEKRKMVAKVLLDWLAKEPEAKPIEGTNPPAEEKPPAADEKSSG